MSRELEELGARLLDAAVENRPDRERVTGQLAALRASVSMEVLADTKVGPQLLWLMLVSALAQESPADSELGAVLEAVGDLGYAITAYVAVDCGAHGNIEDARRASRAQERAGDPVTNG